MKTKKVNSYQINLNAAALCKCSTIYNVAKLIQSSKNELVLLAANPFYVHFTVPKKNGKLRYIEAPNAELKKVQRKLNVLFQCFYYLNQTLASYGYILKPRDKKNIKNIKTNAQAHIGNPYMLNVDFENFFHQITEKHIFNILLSSPFNFEKNAANILAKICTYNERLPMGAPTSPVLSNIYCIAFDKELNNWAKNKDITYTRYVDDLCFTSKKEIKIAHFKQIQSIAYKYGLSFNENKTNFFNVNDIKKVTGLVINETIDIDKDFYDELDRDILRLRYTVEAVMIADRTNNTSFLKSFKQEIMGKINFIASIEGYDSVEYQKYLSKYNNALLPNEDLLVRWTKFSNYL